MTKNQLRVLGQALANFGVGCAVSLAVGPLIAGVSGERYLAYFALGLIIGAVWVYIGVKISR